MAISVVSFSFSWCSTGGPGAHSAGFLYCILSPIGLVPKLHQGSRGPLLLGGGFPYQIWSPTHWLHVFTKLYNSSIAHSIFGIACLIVIKRKCHTVHRSLSSGASVYECTMGFLPCPIFFQPSPPTRFLLITAIGMCHFLPVHHFGMARLAGLKVNIQHI